MIRIRRLRVVGSSRNYDVSFLRDGAVRPLSVVAGEISTGKSSVLDFIDYCFGASRHPRQIEVQRQAVKALLEIELDNEVHVIERPLFNPQQFVWLHATEIERLDEPHQIQRLPLGPPGEATSLNWRLLRGARLEGVVLKEAPSRATSPTDQLSFRDVMDLAYLEHNRLLAGHLLHEPVHMKHLKLRQLVEVVFGVHDQELASKGDRIARLEQERDAQRREIESLRGFLEEQQVRPRDELARERARLKGERQRIGQWLKEVETTMAAATQGAEAARSAYAARRDEAAKFRTTLRSRQSLLERIVPLRGQYAEDQRKLVFFAEARQLFDPLSITACPACLQVLPNAAQIAGGDCSLCRQPLTIDAEDDQLDVDVERAAIGRRLRTIDAYIAEVQDDVRELGTQLKHAQQAEAEAQAALNEGVAERLAPFVAHRERLVQRRETAKAQLADINREASSWDAIDRRSSELEMLDSRLTELRGEQRALEANRPSRDLVLTDLTARFRYMLEGFGFPKLYDPEPPYLNPRDFVPHVRGVPYQELRSRGATTLVALAWQLTIFEEAIEQGKPHPGFLLIDSPQSGLKPAEHDVEDPDFEASEIVDLVWNHIRIWSRDHPDAQLIVVDNLPPTFVEPNVVVRYSGRADQPPYGFIDNETGQSSP